MPDEETYTRFSLLLDPEETIPEDLEPEPEVPEGYVRAELSTLTDGESQWSGAGLLESKYMDAVNAFESQSWADTMNLLTGAPSIRPEPTTSARVEESFQKQTNFRLEPFQPQDGLGRVSFTLHARMIPKSIEVKLLLVGQYGDYLLANDDGEGSLLLSSSECVGKVDYTFGTTELYLGLLPSVESMQVRFRVNEVVTPMEFR